MIPTITSQAPLPAGHPHAQLKQVADDLEASFMAEMLKSAGFGKSQESFGGGVGEDQFSSFLVQAQSKEIAKAGGIGLSEHIFNALKDHADV